MLAPDERSVLLDALRPEPGYVLDAAIATTFTVGFEAALVPPLAFARQELGSTDDPLAVLQAVRQCSDRIDVFHQAGQIAVPLRASRLVAYLEPMLHGVRRPRPGHLFHPKIWFLRYRSTDDSHADEQFRLLCLTRNLTTDRAWDVVVRLDGTRQRRPHATNRPLADLIRSLPQRAVTPLPADRAARIAQLADDARHVAFTLPADVDAVRFHLITGRGSEVPDFAGRRHLVVSPFLTDEGLTLVAPSADVTVVSRPESFDGLDPAAGSHLRRHVMLSLPALDDDTDGTAADLVLPFGLHAKMVVAERGHRARVFLGSANATGPAFGGNVEFVVELDGTRNHLGIDATLTGLAAHLEPYDGTPTEKDPLDDLRRRLEVALRVLAEAEWHVRATPAGDTWRLDVTTHHTLRLDDDVHGTVELLTHPGVALSLHHGAKEHGAVDDVPLADVTPFLAVRLEAGGVTVAGVVRAVLHGDPADRLDQVLAAQVDTPEKFLRFLALILGLDAGLDLAAMSQEAESVAGFGAFIGGGVLEAVLRALADNPAAVRDLDRLVRGLTRTDQGRTVLPPGFGPLWATVTSALDRRPGVPA